MYSRRQQKLIGSMSVLGGVPRRRLLKGAGALGLAAILRPTTVFAESDDQCEQLGLFGPWSTPVNLGPVVNSPFHKRRCASRTKKPGSSSCTYPVTVRVDPSGVFPAAPTSTLVRWEMTERSVPRPGPGVEQPV
jgi:hypothetical protein